MNRAALDLAIHRGYAEYPNTQQGREEFGDPYRAHCEEHQLPYVEVRIPEEVNLPARLHIDCNTTNNQQLSDQAIDALQQLLPELPERVGLQHAHNVRAGTLHLPRNLIGEVMPQVMNIVRNGLEPRAEG